MTRRVRCNVLKSYYLKVICVYVTARNSFSPVATFQPIIDCNSVTVTLNGNSIAVLVLEER